MENTKNFGGGTAANVKEVEGLIDAHFSLAEKIALGAATAITGGFFALRGRVQGKLIGNYLSLPYEGHPTAFSKAADHIIPAFREAKNSRVVN